MILEELLKNFQVSDFVDIAISSIIFFVLIHLLTQSPIRKHLGTIFFCTILYLAANHLGLYLILYIFQMIFAFIVVAFAVIYQDEIKRFLDSISSFNFFSLKKSEKQFLDLDVFSETVDRLASNRVGALFVFKGIDSLDPFLNGGILLNGVLSQPLILSIFDSSSPGHDGALIVENGIISKFACHLPITKNYKLLAGRGTRHAAALGLTEKTDALIVVVSEETGRISLVEGGKIKTLESISEFKSQISNYYVEKHPKSTPMEESNFTEHIAKRVVKPTVAIFTAVFAWYLFAFNPNKLQKTFSVPIVYRNMPEELKVDQDYADEVKITLSAFEREFKFMDPGSFRATIDLSKVRQGTQYIHLSRENLNIPSRFSIYKMHPTSIKLKIEEKTSVPSNN